MHSGAELRACVCARQLVRVMRARAVEPRTPRARARASIELGVNQSHTEPAQRARFIQFAACAARRFGVQSQRGDDVVVQDRA